MSTRQQPRPRAHLQERRDDLSPVQKRYLAQVDSVICKKPAEASGQEGGSDCTDGSLRHAQRLVDTNCPSSLFVGGEASSRSDSPLVYDDWHATLRRWKPVTWRGADECTGAEVHVARAQWATRIMALKAIRARSDTECRAAVCLEHYAITYTTPAEEGQ